MLYSCTRMATVGFKGLIERVVSTRVRGGEWIIIETTLM